MSLPPEEAAYIWRGIAARERRRAEACEDWLEYVWDNTAPPLIDIERQRYAEDLLTIDEFEQRVETILRGAPRWWDG